MTARYAKRAEAREVAAEIERELRPVDLEWLASLEPALYDLPDCEHGRNGDSPCGERCTFICHPAAG